MTKKNKGWDYLNSNDVSSMSDGAKNDWGYTNSDGSGSFHGGDGSWGYRNSDGSGSYYGSDGSWGYTNSDGSGSFNDADGSWGYRNADGSISYHGSDGSWGYRNSDGGGSFYGGSDDSETHHYGNNEDSDSNDSDWGEAIGTIIGAGLAGLAYAAKKQAKNDYADKKVSNTKERVIREWRLANPKGKPMDCVRDTGISRSTVYKWWDDCSPIKTKVKNFMRKDNDEKYAWLALAGITLIGFLIFIFAFAIPSCTDFANEKAGLICAGDSDDLVGEKYSTVVEHLKAAGFSNIELVDLKDSGLTFWRDGKVKEVVIDGDNSFGKHDWFDTDAKVVIIYH